MAVDHPLRQRYVHGTARTVHAQWFELCQLEPIDECFLAVYTAGDYNFLHFSETVCSGYCDHWYQRLTYILYEFFDSVEDCLAHV